MLAEKQLEQSETGSKDSRYGLAKTTLFRILIVDDCIDTLNLVSGVADYLEMDPTVAVDGIEATEILKYREFDAVVLDWNMEYKSGAETLRQMDQFFGKAKSLKKPHILIYSGVSSDEIKIPEMVHLAKPKLLSKSVHYRDLIEILRSIERGQH